MNSDDINHFNNLAEHWWNKNGVFKILHQVNPLRMEFIEKHQKLQGKKVLDLGCGGGILSETLAQAGAEVIAVDLAPESIDVAKKHAKQQKLKIKYQCIAVEKLLSKHQNNFDIICCMEMLEHVDDPQSILQTLSELLKDDGVLFASTLNRNALSWILGIVVAEKLLGWIPSGSHNLSRFIKPAELAQMARNAQLSFSHSTGIIWHPLKQTFELSSKRLEINYISRFKKI